MIYRMLRIGGRRLGDERGSVGVLVALVMFFVIGMLTMTYNTTRLSTEKIRLQNAADAAALEHAAWQARGMNMIQNLNNEAYVALRFSNELIGICCGLNVLRFAMDTMAKLLRGFPLAAAIFVVMEKIAYVVIRAGLFMATWIAKGLVGGVITVLQAVCQYTPILGYLTAQKLAAANGASRAGEEMKVLGIDLGVYAIGIATSDVLTMFSLPVKRDDSAGAPFITANDKYKESFRDFACSRPDLEKHVPEFNFHPMVSEKLEEKDYIGNIHWKMPSPVVWYCFKDAEAEIRLLPLAFWDRGFETRGAPKKPRRRLLNGHGGYGHMMAVAAAQCITGDVVKQSTTAKKDEFCIQRPAGLGTGASAKLVPVAEALPKGLDFSQLIFH